MWWVWFTHVLCWWYESERSQESFPMQGEQRSAVWLTFSHGSVHVLAWWAWWPLAPAPRASRGCASWPGTSRTGSWSKTSGHPSGSHLWTCPGSQMNWRERRVPEKAEVKTVISWINFWKEWLLSQLDYCSSSLQHYRLTCIILIPIIASIQYIVFPFYIRNELWCWSNASQFAHWMCVFQRSGTAGRTPCLEHSWVQSSPESDLNNSSTSVPPFLPSLPWQTHLFLNMRHKFDLIVTSHFKKIITQKHCT